MAGSTSRRTGGIKLMSAKTQLRVVVDGDEICFLNKEGEEIHSTPLKDLSDSLSLVVWQERLEGEPWMTSKLRTNANTIVRAYLLGCLLGE
jgi:hypothetical protein